MKSAIASPSHTHSEDHASGPLRFGACEIDLISSTLRRNDAPVALRAQTWLLLSLLIQRPEALLTRDEIRASLWPSEDETDHDEGINACVRELRQALGDSASKPVFIETIPKRGYRWIAAVDAPSIAPIQQRTGRSSRTYARWMVIVATVVAMGSWWFMRTREQIMVVVAMDDAISPARTDSITALLGRHMRANNSRITPTALRGDDLFDVQGARLHRGGRQLSIAFILEVSPDSAGAALDLYRASDKSLVWRGHSNGVGEALLARALAGL